MQQVAFACLNLSLSLFVCVSLCLIRLSCTFDRVRRQFGTYASVARFDADLGVVRARHRRSRSRRQRDDPLGM